MTSGTGGTCSKNVHDRKAWLENYLLRGETQGKKWQLMCNMLVQTLMIRFYVKLLQGTLAHTLYHSLDISDMSRTTFPRRHVRHFGCIVLTRSILCNNFVHDTLCMLRRLWARAGGQSATAFGIQPAPFTQDQPTNTNADHVQETEKGKENLDSHQKRCKGTTPLEVVRWFSGSSNREPLDSFVLLWCYKAVDVGFK